MVSSSDLELEMCDLVYRPRFGAYRGLWVTDLRFRSLGFGFPTRTAFTIQQNENEREQQNSWWQQQFVYDPTVTLFCLTYAPHTLQDLGFRFSGPELRV